MEWGGLQIWWTIWSGVVWVVQEFRERYTPFSEGAAQLQLYEEPQYGLRLNHKGVIQSFESGPHRSWLHWRILQKNEHHGTFL